jgi:DNA-binding NarL/FixJ family response regulator
MNSTETAHIRVVIADNHVLLRAGVRAILAGREDVEIVGEASDGDQALRLVAELRPEVAVLDISMPVLNGLEATARIAAEFPDTKVLVLSMHTDVEYVLRALHSGATGYLVKDNSVAELQTAILTVAQGERYLSPSVSDAVVMHLRLSGRGLSDERLTDRQRDVLRLIAEGKLTRQIAQILGISVYAVETTRTSLMEELNVDDLAGLIRHAFRAGVVSTGE